MTQASKADLDNPFAVQTPEDIRAEDVITLFVNVFTDFHRVPFPEHCFLHGPRGSGKSMMFRFLQPDCQCLHLNCKVHELPYLGIYVPVKNTSLDLAELMRIEKMHAAVLLNEHFLITYISVKAFGSLAGLQYGDDKSGYAQEIRRFYNDTFVSLLKSCGWKGRPAASSHFTSVSDGFRVIERDCLNVYRKVLRYLKQVSFREEPVPYTDALCGFEDFLLPLFESLRTLSFLPHAPFYLLIDDADNLNLTQTRILNSWVSSRTSSKLSVKISTQLNYKTYSTVTGRTIDTPHDYTEINIADVYTSQRSPYRNRVEQIVKRRLHAHGIDASPDEFFPKNEKQEKRITEIAAAIRRKWDTGEGKGYRADDDVSRYARAEYIRSLKGKRKQGSTYSYAGFSQLVDISSGIVRYFLEAAALMFAREKAAGPTKTPVRIRHQTQSKTVRDLADEYMFAEFEKIALDDKYRATLSEDTVERGALLRNLILSMGRTFHEILVSDRSERRVFSIALYDAPSAEVAAVLALGVQYGYLHQSTIGNKDGTGRTWLYVLSRRLAPFFLLDPTGFAGYLFVKSSDLERAMRVAGSRLRNLKLGSDGEQREPYQLPLFSLGD